MDKLIEGVIAVVMLSLVTGQYGKLREFAKKEVVKALSCKSTYPSNKAYKGV